MKLTQKQEWLVARYVRAFTNELADMPDASRENAVSQLKNRIEKELEQFDSFEDEAVLNLLKRIGHPTELAAEVKDKPVGTYSLTLATDDRVWLGVCAGLARYLEMPVSQIRWMALALGVTGPIALTIYLILYFVMYIMSRPDAPMISPKRLAIGLLGTIAILAALNVAANMVCLGVEKAFLFGVKRPLPELAQWGWLAIHKNTIVFWAFFTLVPMGVFSSLPAANDWDATAKRLVQAGISIYAVILCAGLASLLVGAILEATHAFAAGI